MRRILLVEDDSTLAYGVEYTLKGEGFNIIVASTLEKARKLFREKEFDLILLDLSLPDGKGYDMSMDIRKKSGVPIIFLTAKDEEINIVTELDMGADGYITKPFRIRELISRVRAVLRRYSKEDLSVGIITSGDLVVNTSQNKIVKNKKELFLTGQEYKLLITFMKQPLQVLGRDYILEGLWDINGYFVDDNTLSVYIRRLRSKIEDDPQDPKYIVTVRGMGYKWDMDVRGKLY
ncbi:response regulator transcription factor [Clostridium sp. DL1XJH146]